jgi:hypothetical protein
MIGPAAAARPAAKNVRLRIGITVVWWEADVRDAAVGLAVACSRTT